MDYKSIYLQHYNKALKDQEKSVIKIFAELKAKKRTYFYSRDKISRMLFMEKEEFESMYRLDILSKYVDLIKQPEDFYSEDNFNLILENEIKEIFQEEKPFGMLEYHQFLKKIAHWHGLKDAYFNFGAHNWLMELYYEYGEIEKISLDPLVKDIKVHEDFIRLSSKKFPDYEKIVKPEPIKFKTEAKLELPILDYDEKLLLIHYLLHSSSIEKIEKVKILALLGTTPISVDIFKQESRNNNQYNQIRRGYQYTGIKKARENLKSLFEHVEIFKIDNLNRAIKIDLNKLRKKDIEDNLKKV